MFQIRKFQAHDALKASALISVSINESLGRQYPRIVAAYYLNKYSPKALLKIAKRADIYLCEHKGKMVGSAFLCGSELFGLYVHPSFHNQGIGTLLVRHIERVAKVRILWLLQNIHAWRFYKKLGYKAVFNLPQLRLLYKRL